MENFFIDKLGDDCDDVRNTNVANGIENNCSFRSTPKIDIFDELPDSLKYKETKVKPKNLFNLDDTYLITSYKNLNKEENLFPSLSKVLKKSVVQPDLERQYSIPAEKKKKTLKLERKKLRQRTKGKKWFDMQATELTEEIKTDFDLLKMRSVLDRKHVYKKNDITKVPKFFQVGKIIETSADFYSSRVPKSQRKKTMVEELLADAEFKKYQKKKFKEIMDENRRKKHTKKYLGGNKTQKKVKSKK